MENNYKRFKGYTLKELRYRMVVNSAKQQQVKAGIDESVSTVTNLFKSVKSKPEEPEFKPGLLGKIDAIITAGNYAIAGYTLFKNIKSVFGK